MDISHGNTATHLRCITPNFLLILNLTV